MINGALAVCLVTRVGLLIVGIIPKRSIRFTKFWTFFLATKSNKLMFKSPAKVTSLCEIFRFEIESFSSNFLGLCDHRLVDNELNLAQYFSNFCFEL